MRFRLRSLLLFVATISLAGGAIYGVAHFDDPLAVIVVSDDPTLALTQETALQLTADALRQAGLEPLDPQPYKHEAIAPERFLGRNALQPDDQVSVIWSAKGGRYDQYTVRLKRTPMRIVASVCENWL